MSFKFYKRIKLSKGLGINISKSGISTSYRNKFGSIGSKGYSLKTGIPGLSYRKSFAKRKGCLLWVLILIGIEISVIVVIS
ncbi:DUF4236 domain-containing protein [Aquimarina pacifica]|uniref:DUF4236 domain-containing protein n=1 Tax=Aquimarina pacifica TaxID=1296415 RepID=UPI000472E748|nr:DUF4236 domain-containing protein [Aquimarina pacifica]